MPKVTFIERNGTRREFDAPVGLSLLEVAHKHNIDLEGACEGSLACSTCHVVVEPEWYDLLPDATEDEEDMLDLAFALTKTSRLGCQIIVSEELDGLTVRLPAGTRNMPEGLSQPVDSVTHDPTPNDLPKGARVVVAMSGGVDSSVVAALLTGQGYEVIGATLRLYDDGALKGKAGSCCAGADIADARAVAGKLGIPHYVLDYESRFRAGVIDDFADSYIRGETPIPCVRCNQEVKFGDLLDMARTLGADALATGHYAQRVAGPNGPELHRGADMSRDQSYFLFATTHDQLAFLRFPLGGLPKSEVRRLAQDYGLAIAEKPDSQDICFVPNGSYADVVQKLRPNSVRPGKIVDLEGRALGDHEGIIHYTIGQRRGLGIAGGEPLYVVSLDPARDEVVIGPKAALARDRVHLSDMNWLIPVTVGETLTAEVKLRSAQPLASATVIALTNGLATVDLDGAQFGVARGQACVIYQEHRVIGGGWIQSTERRSLAAA